MSKAREGETGWCGLGEEVLDCSEAWGTGKKEVYLSVCLIVCHLWFLMPELVNKSLC